MFFKRLNNFGPETMHASLQKVEKVTIFVKMCWIFIEKSRFINVLDLHGTVYRKVKRLTEIVNIRVFVKKNSLGHLSA